MATKHTIRLLALLLALTVYLTAGAYAASEQKTVTDKGETLYVYLLGGEEFAVKAADKIDFERKNPEAAPLMQDADETAPTAADFSRMTVTESLLNAMREDGRDAAITLNRCTYEGAITPEFRTGILWNAKGESPVSLTLLNGSRWTVTAESRLTRLAIDRSSVIEGASMTVDGEETEIAVGVYEGEIVLTPGEKTLSAVEINGEAYVTLESLLEAMK